MYILNKGEQNMYKENVDFNSMPKQEVIDMLGINTMLQMPKAGRIDMKYVHHKTTLSLIEHLATEVVNDADEKTLRLLGTDVYQTFVGLGAQVINMLDGFGISLECPTADTEAQLTAIHGKLRVSQNG